MDFIFILSYSKNLHINIFKMYQIELRMITFSKFYPSKLLFQNKNEQKIKSEQFSFCLAPVLLSFLANLF